MELSSVQENILQLILIGHNVTDFTDVDQSSLKCELVDICAYLTIERLKWSAQLDPCNYGNIYSQYEMSAEPLRLTVESLNAYSLIQLGLDIRTHANALNNLIKLVYKNNG